MLRPRTLIALLASACCVAACDSVEGPTPVSTFRAEDPFARQIFGRVLQGTETVEGALVRVDTSSALASDVELAATSELPRTTSTDAAGFYRVQFAPFIYDLSVRHDRLLFVMRGVAARLMEPPLGDDAPVTGYRARVVPTTVPPPDPGNAVAYYVSGVDARALSGEPASLVATFRKFDTTITLRALEYVRADGLTHVVRAGRVDFRVQSETAAAPVVAMSDVTVRKKVTFEAALPEGFTLASLDVELDGGLRTSAVTVTQAALGVPLELSIVPDAAYTVRGRAVAGGAVSSSGRLVFDPNLERVSVVFPPPVSAEAPVDDELPVGAASGGLAPVTLEAGGVLAARFDAGVVEHVLSPLAGDGAIVRIVTAARSTTLPEVTRMGLPQPAGRYAWTLQHFPTLTRVDKLSGADGRIVPPSSTSAPKVIVLR